MDNQEAKMSELQQFYSGANVLITGATGFMGKVLIEKLLRSCPQVNRIFMLVREKRGKNIEERLDQFTSSPCFDRLKAEVPEYRSKLHPISGDIVSPNLGLSDQDLAILTEEVNIVFHVAATVRFDEQLNIAIKQNVKATRDLVYICHSFKRLLSLVHVSTAYANCPNSHINECFYDTPMDCDKAIQMAECVDEGIMDGITPKILGKWPNSYSFSKALAEEVVKKHGQGLPIGVFRPAIVICTRSEPSPGWIDNLYGPGGVYVGVISGVMRTAQGDHNTTANCVPCDMAVNGLIASARDIALTWFPSQVMPVYNYVSSHDNEITWYNYLERYIVHMKEMPYSKAIWHPMMLSVKSRFLALFLRLFLHFLPGLLMDTLLLLSGRKPRMISTYQKIHKYTDIIAYFSIQRWSFEETNIVAMWDRLSDKDKKLFPFDMRTLDWDTFFRDTCPGLRRHLLKDGNETIEAAKTRRHRLHLIHLALQAVVTCAALYYSTRLVSVIQSYI